MPSLLHQSRVEQKTVSQCHTTVTRNLLRRKQLRPDQHNGPHKMSTFPSSLSLSLSSLIKWNAVLYPPIYSTINRSHSVQTTVENRQLLFTTRLGSRNYQQIWPGQVRNNNFWTTVQRARQSHIVYIVLFILESGAAESWEMITSSVCRRGSPAIQMSLLEARGRAGCVCHYGLCSDSLGLHHHVCSYDDPP